MAASADKPDIAGLMGQAAAVNYARAFLINSLRHVIGGGDVTIEELDAAIADPAALRGAERKAWHGSVIGRTTKTFGRRTRATHHTAGGSFLTCLPTWKVGMTANDDIAVPRDLPVRLC
jgi:hypothetical protein